MAKKPKKPSDDVDPTVLEEPVEDEETIESWDPEEDNVWLRGLWMVVFACLFGIGEFILGVCAVLQFLWLLFAKEKNEPIAEFGKDLGEWLARVTLFQTAATEDKPFPFARWGE